MKSVPPVASAPGPAISREKLCQFFFVLGQVAQILFIEHDGRQVLIRLQADRVRVFLHIHGLEDRSQLQRNRKNRHLGPDRNDLPVWLKIGSSYMKPVLPRRKGKFKLPAVAGPGFRHNRFACVGP